MDGDPGAARGRPRVEGVDEVLTVQTPQEHFDAHAAEQALEALIAAEEPSVVVLGHSVDSFGFAPAVAAKGGLGFATDALEISWDGGPVVRRGAYGDHLVAELDFPGKDTVVVLVRAGAFDPASGGGLRGDARGRRRPRRVGDRDRARRVPRGGGRRRRHHQGRSSCSRSGAASRTRTPSRSSQELADAIGATLSVSRPLVDAGWMSSARQVGQSGKTVKPKVYLALGISGAVQHLAGMRKADTIIAVNTDPEAPIF